MGLNIFKKKLSKKRILSEIQEQKAMITRHNEFYMRFNQRLMGSGVFLDRDLKTDEYVKKGYEGNADIFSIATKIATKFATPPSKLQVKRKNRWEDVDSHEFLEVIKNPNHFQTLFEFKMTWELFRLITGNSMVYAPKLKAGNNAGKLTPDGLLMMPTQNIEIESKSWRQPIGSYQFTIDYSSKGIEPAHVWHERFPSLQYEEGRNFMGLSPLKAALQILNRQNSSYERAAAMYEQGMPSHLITDPSLTQNPSQEQKDKFTKNWKDKYGENRNIQVPALAPDGVKVHKLGYDSVKELGLLESTQDGRRALCNVFQVAAELFNDSVGSTFNNRGEARKEMWTDRIMVDHTAFYDGINNDILPGYAGNEIMRFVPDYSEVEELQEDKGKKSGWTSRMYQDGAITGNEYREYMGVKIVDGDQHLDTRYIPINKIPAEQAFTSDVLEPTGDEEKAYNEMSIDY